MSDLVLVVDDSRTLRALLVNTLRDEGYACREAADVDSALEVMEQCAVSLVISDILMPGRSGLELLKELHARYRDTFVVMLTSIIDTETAMRCMHLGAVDYLIKPFSSDRLSVTVRNALEQRRLFLEQKAYEAELERKVKEQTEQIRLALVEKALINKEMELARAIQAALIPQYFPCTERLAFAALYRPAGHLGGDYYDLFMRGDGIIDVVIADVTGHSVGSALIVAEIRGALQGQPAASNRGCGEMIAMLNEALYDDLTRAELYVSMFYLRFDEKAMKISYASAGHNPQLLLRSGGDLEELSAEGMIIGVVPLMEYEEQSTVISRGDRFFLFTDGMIEAENRDGEQFGAERLSAALRGAIVEDSHEALRQVLGAMETFTLGVPLKDDLSLVVATIR